MREESKREYDRQWYNANKDRIRADKIEAQNKWRNKIKQIVIDAKNRPCKDCGHEYPPHVMDFDHLRDKDFTIGLKKLKIKESVLRAEIAKCDVVCANCHRQRTFERKSG